VYKRHELLDTEREVLSSIPSVVALEALLFLHSVTFRAGPTFGKIRVRVDFQDQTMYVSFPYVPKLDFVRPVEVESLYLISLIRLKDALWSVTPRQKRLYELASTKDWRETFMSALRGSQSYIGQVDFQIVTSPLLPFSICGKTITFDPVRITHNDAWDVYLFDSAYRETVLEKWRKFLEEEDNGRQNL